MARLDHDAPFRLDTGSRALRGAVALCVASLDALDAEAADFLSPAEAALLTERLAPRRRHALLAGRRAAKSALRHLVPDTPSRAIAVLPGFLDQPVVSGPGTGNIQVTLSHTGPVAVAIAYPEACPMGVDLDMASPDHRAALVEQTGVHERDLAAAVVDGDEDRRLMTLWCLKEALSKALRCGLTVPFGLLDIASLDRDGPGFRARFTNFGQYAGVGVSAGRLCLAVVMPRTVRWTLADGSDPMAILAHWLAQAGASSAPDAVQGEAGG